jgi:hypothetical protein
VPHPGDGNPSENARVENAHVGKLEILDLNMEIDWDEYDRIMENSTNYVETGRNI